MNLNLKSWLKPKIKSINILILIAIIVLTFATGFKILSMFNSQLGFDEAGIVYIAKEISQGKALYLDYFDHKPPLMHHLLALIYSVIPISAFTIKLLAFIFDTALLGTIFLMSKKLLDKNYAFLASSLYSVYNLSLSLNTEIIMTILGLWAFFFYVKALESDKIDNFNLFISGIFIAIAIWFKQSALFFYIPIVAHLFYLKYKQKIQKSQLINNILLLTLGVLIISIPLLSFFLFKAGTEFFYAIIKFNLQFKASSSRILQIGKGIGILLSSLGIIYAISLANIKELIKDKKEIASAIISFNIFILIFIFIGQEIFYQHFFQLIPFAIMLGFISLKLADKKVRTFMFIALLITILTISLSAIEIKARESNNQRQVLDYLLETIPWEAKFFSDNPVYTLLGNYHLPQPLVHVAPSFASVFNYSFICKQDYLVLTHRQKYLSQDVKQCIKSNFTLIKRFDNVGESFVEVYIKHGNAKR